MSFEELLLVLQSLLLAHTGSLLQNFLHIALGHPFNLENLLSLKINIPIFEPFGIILPYLYCAFYVGDFFFKINLFLFHFHDGLDLY